MGRLKGKAPNVLRLGVFRAKGLTAVDKNLLTSGASADPRLRFAAEGVPAFEVLTTTRHHVAPVWKEVYETKLRGDNPKLTCYVEDWDQLSAAGPRVP